MGKEENKTDTRSERETAKSEERELKLQCVECFIVFNPDKAKQKDTMTIGIVDLCCPKCGVNVHYVSSYKIYPEDQKTMDDYNDK